MLCNCSWRSSVNTPYWCWKLSLYSVHSFYNTANYINVHLTEFKSNMSQCLFSVPNLKEWPLKTHDLPITLWLGNHILQSPSLCFSSSQFISYWDFYMTWDSRQLHHLLAQTTSVLFHYKYSSILSNAKYFSLTGPQYILQLFYLSHTVCLKHTVLARQVCNIDTRMQTWKF